VTVQLGWQALTRLSDSRASSRPGGPSWNIILAFRVHDSDSQAGRGVAARMPEQLLEPLSLVAAVTVHGYSSTASDSESKQRAVASRPATVGGGLAS
jgi:hypothetical protein